MSRRGGGQPRGNINSTRRRKGSQALTVAEATTLVRLYWHCMLGNNKCWTWLVTKKACVHFVSTVTVKVLQEGALNVGRVILRRLSLNGHSLVTLRRRLHVHCSGIPGHRALHIGRFLLRRGSWNGYSSLKLKRDCICIIRFSMTRALQGGRVLYRRCVEMVVHLVVILGGETIYGCCWALLGQRSWDSRVILGTWSWNGKTLNHDS